MRSSTAPLVFAIVLIIGGFILLFFAEKVRTANLRVKGTGIRPMTHLMSPRQEIWSIRASGAGAILMGLFIGLILWMNR